ncbi:MAG: ECF transporter S component [bacterium]
MKERISRTAAIGIFSALTLAGGYLFISIPNVEIFTATVFLSGLVMGSKNGMWVGLIAQTLFSILNPFGVSPPPLFIAQVLNRIIVGYVGGHFQFFLKRQRQDFKKVGFVFGITGLLLTWLSDLMTDFSFFFISGFSLEQMKVTFALGVPWYLIHGIGNVLVFAIALPLVAKALDRLEYIKTIS